MKYEKQKPFDYPILMGNVNVYVCNTIFYFCKNTCFYIGTITGINNSYLKKRRHQLSMTFDKQTKHVIAWGRIPGR